MRLSEWIEKHRPGGITRLQEGTRDAQGQMMAWTTVAAIVKGKVRARYDSAERLSAATGRDVSVDEVFAAYKPKQKPVAESKPVPPKRKRAAGESRAR